MAQYQLKLKERRGAERRKLTGLMPGRFQVDGKDISARPVDISEHGIGVLVSKEFKVGSVATLTMKNQIIQFEVKWGQPDFGKHDLWRFGLVCQDEAVNVMDVFAQAGCFK